MGSAMLSLLAEWKNRFIPFMEWIHVLKDKSVIKADLMAGLTVALVLVPQSMAYADLAKLPPYVGLYASFIPVIIASLFGSSRQLATGPVAMVSLMTAGAIGMLGFSDNPEQAMFYAAFLAIMVGAIQLSLGLFRLGVLVDFLSHPVIIGFTNAAALIIASSQISKLFGLTIEGTFEHHYEKVWAIVQAIPETHIVTLAMGALSIFILVYVKKINPRLPNVLIAVVICTLISHFTGYAAKGGAVIGLFDSELPSFSIPQIDYARIGELVMIAFMIALIGFVEAISVAKAIASQTRQRLSANQELVGQGLANIAAGLFQAYPVSGSFSRSAVNFTAGAKTALSAIVTGILVAITILFLTSYLKNLPQATLAAVIIVAVAGLIKIEPIKHAWKVHRHDGIISVIVFIATLVAAPHLEQGVLVGVVLSLGLFLYRTMSPRLLEVARHEDTTLRDAKRFGLKTSDTVSVMRYDGDLYFANAGYLEGKLLNLVASKPKLKVIVLDIEAVDQLDSSGEEMLKQLYDRLQTVGIELYFARAKKQIIDAFIRSGLYAHIGDKYFFRQRTDAVKAAKEDLGDAIDISSYLKPIHNG